MARGRYTITRLYFSHSSRVIKRGLTLAEARAHCRDPETSSRTCSEATRAAEKTGPWFDGYDSEDGNDWSGGR